MGGGCDRERSDEEREIDGLRAEVARIRRERASNGDRMSFGEALQALKDGCFVARTGWNGKGMHVYLEGAHDIPIRGGAYRGQVRRVEPVLCMYTATGTHQPGWLASQADMLANDWKIVGP